MPGRGPQRSFLALGDALDVIRLRYERLFSLPFSLVSLFLRQDRGSLVAVAVELRSLYAQTLQRLVRRGQFRYLLATVEYSCKSGEVVRTSPFSISRVSMHLIS